MGQIHVINYIFQKAMIHASHHYMSGVTFAKVESLVDSPKVRPELIHSNPNCKKKLIKFDQTNKSYRFNPTPMKKESMIAKLHDSSVRINLSSLLFPLCPVL